MVQAYILIQSEVGKSSHVAREVGAIDGVVKAEEVTGPYDVIARVEQENVTELGQLVIAKIQDIGGITRTLTCTVVHG
ncbi:Lrp/AsnC ligand binding domain-containing protein [Arsenicicoccus piscis]|uniref:AsnC family transcriptional regulator n=1 Tax=Arsenicicoccus piscis TaxID=673954 RepID=A0ABQ6HNA4_9MICO|nr:Lrp/AsnC ligand binding domain-containing protein [Arsenicicoccus piscis]MCH8626901.1 Lrp/AsnC ligand binding domain-containing protein [Arsenicicoccus piscis]GMA19184.1 AsnC family transcriptional regulator [Arsenicicoccus piscis]